MADPSSMWAAKLGKNVQMQRHGESPKLFVVNIEPRLMADLSPRACKLLMALLHRADGRTGQLKITRSWGRAAPYWFKGKDFDRWAHMSEPTRLLAMRELITKGFVTIERPRVHQIIDGRMRAVAGPSQYTLHRHPAVPEDHRESKDSSKLKVRMGIQNQTSTGHEEVGQEVFQNTPSRVGAGSVSVFPVSENPRVTHDHHHHRPSPNEDDEISAKEFSISTPKPNPKTQIFPLVEETSKTQKIPPELRSWMDTRILARAKDPVKNRGAFLRKSRAEFLENMGEEVEIYLQERAETYMAQWTEEKGSVCYGLVYKLLQSETDRHGLPIGLWAEAGQESEEFSVTMEEPDSVYWRIYENAAEVLGLVNTE
jgi:hypothetical protein